MPTFILGAGFNVDATAEAGLNDCSYPLVDDTLRLCFGLDRIPDGKSIEDLFSDALERKDYSPLRKLAHRLRKADYYIASRIASDKTDNCYWRFFQAFDHNHFLTFNYDSLPQTFLFRLGWWYPHDGYGVPVVARLSPSRQELAAKESSTLVLHLHGSLCIRTYEYKPQRRPGQVMGMLTKRDEPRYAFDPSEISNNFSPFLRDPGDDVVEDRIIAPVPDKAQGLGEAFIRDTYSKAFALIRGSDIVVTIGYSFNPNDRASYAPPTTRVR